MKRILAGLFFSFIFANFSFAASFAEGMAEGIGSVVLPLAVEAADKQSKAVDADDQGIKQLLKDIAKYKIKTAMLELQLKEYIIPEGMSLGLIARRFNTTVEKIMELNKGNPAIKSRDLILADYKIYLPAYSEDEVKKLETELIGLLADEYISAREEIEYEQNKANDTLTELVKVKIDLAKKTDDARFFKAEAGWLTFLALMLFLGFTVALAWLVSEKEKSAKLKTSKRESLIALLEQRPVGEVLQVLNMAVLGDERNPKTLKKLRDYIDELTRGMTNKQYAVFMARLLRELPGYNRQ